VSFDVSFATTLDGAWRVAPSLCIGRPSSDASTYVLVERDGAPLLTIALGEDGGPFRDAILWSDRVVIGYGDAIHVVDVATHVVVTHRLDGYYGHLFAMEDVLLVTDARTVLRLNVGGAILWRSGWIGIDGVTIEAVEQGIIRGEGEWDPPGGWKPFRLSLETGERVSDPSA
jgi:hypothetical protein